MSLRTNPFVCCALGLGLIAACSFSNLDYLRAERDQPLASGGNAGAGASSISGGGSPTLGGTGGSEVSPSGGTRTSSGGTREEPLGRGGQEAGGGGEATPGSAGADGGSESSGGKQGSGGGSGDAGSQAGVGAGDGGSNPEPGVTYGIDGQSCATGLACPGGGSCCRRITVPAGTFSMGTNSDPEAASDEKPPHSATLSAFDLDQFEVTVGRFRRFVDVYDGTAPASGAGANAHVTQSGWQVGFSAQLPATRAALEDQLNCDIGAYQSWTTQAGARETMPINCVNWYVAFAFCVWDGGRLPSEAEWERASAGGEEERLYPWGATAPDFAIHAVANCQADGKSGCAPADLLAVGSRPQGAGRWGHLDLAGSVWEWTLDHYDATYYQSVGSCSDCANVSAQTPRVLRGGNFTAPARSLRGTGRASKAPGVADAYAGIRCARSR